MKDSHIHEFVAFAFCDEQKDVYTIRSSLDNASQEIKDECVAVFGADFNTVAQSLTLYADLDKEYIPERLFD